MAKGLLVKILLHTRTTHYLDFAKVGGSYVMAKAVVNNAPSMQGLGVWIRPISQLFSFTDLRQMGPQTTACGPSGARRVQTIRYVCEDPACEDRQACARGPLGV